MLTLKNIKKHPNNIIVLGCFIIKKNFESVLQNYFVN